MKDQGLSIFDNEPEDTESPDSEATQVIPVVKQSGNEPAAQQTRVRSGDREAVHFAWYGPNTPEKAFGYRLIGDGFVIEMGSVDDAAQHLHTVYHDLGNVLGRG